MKRHVCIDARLIVATGIGTFLRYMISCLAQDKSFDLSLLFWEKNRHAFARYPECNLLPLQSPIYSLKEQKELALIVPKCDLFWSPLFNVPLFVKAKKRLVTIHDTYHLTFFKNLSFSQKLYASFFYRAACKLSDAVTTVSQFSASEIRKHLSVKEAKLFPIRLGAPSGYRPLKETEKIRQKYHLPPKYLLTVTNFKAHKNFERLEKACRGILPLVVIGEKKKIEGVFCTGPVSEEDMNALYSGAELLVFPSPYEGFGLPPLEAMAAGCPVVVSGSGAIPEVCQDAAEYVDPLCVSSIRSGILRVLEHPEHRLHLIQKGLQRAKERSFESAAQEYLHLIKRLI